MIDLALILTVAVVGVLSGGAVGYIIRYKTEPPPEPAWMKLLDSGLAKCVLRAVEKSAIDPSWGPNDGPAKRREAVEWSNTYAKMTGLPKPKEWEVNFLVEYFTGTRKGRL